VALPYRLGIDVGTNSLGWCVLDLGRDGHPCGIRRMGVRIFSDGRDPQKGTSLAVDRRLARQMRRRRDRFLARREGLMRALVRHGLMPADPQGRKALEALDPYCLRARGLDQPLTPHELGRALFHLNQRRGFLSNRKTERASQSEAEASGIKAAVAALERRIAESGARTLGEYLHRQFREGRPVRQRQSVRARLRGEGAKAAYDLYPSRAMYLAEFDALWDAQKAHRPGLADEARATIRRILFFQRPLKPVDPGKCALDPTDRRAPLALPSVQLFRMLSELANLRIVSPDQSQRPLTVEERDRVLAKLRPVATELKFEKIRRILELPADAAFNLESAKRSGLKGDATGRRLAGKDRFGPAWWTLPLERQDAIVETLLEEADDRRVVEIAQRDWGLDAQAAQAVADCPLPAGYGRLGRRALARMLPVMLRGVVRYDDAAREAGYHHSDHRTGEAFDALPYYGYVLDRYVGHSSGEADDPPERRYGRIANPTVHIGLNQLRKLLNALIARYGKPAQIVVELARELKQSQARREEAQKTQAENQRLNDLRRQKLAELGIADNGENRLKLRLWEELNPKEPHNRRCVYTGEMISLERLFGPEVEVEHILPFKRTLDNSPANKTVSMRYANRAKGNATPHEAFAASPAIGGSRYVWADILARAASMPRNKQWRFAADAMERFARDGDFVDRQLTDTQYLARVTRQYLACLYPGEESRVWVTPGRLTEMLRGKWGLNRLLSDHNLKNRSDHRHHAIDAFVVGVTDRAMLQRIAGAADQVRDRLIDDMPEPWEGFRDRLKDRLDRIVVSLRPDHGTAGRLHEETAYGIVRDPAAWGGATLVSRKPLAGLNANEIERIRDANLRERVKAHVEAARAAAPSWGALPLRNALLAFSAQTGVARVRLLKIEEKVIGIGRGSGASYKAYVPGDNHHIDIYELPNGKWAGEAVSTFHANQPGHVPAWRTKHPGAKLVMRVHKGDMLRLEHDGKARVMRVVRLEAKAQRFRLAEHHESGDLEGRHNAPNETDPFRWLFVSFNQLKTRKAKKIGIGILGAS